MVNTSCFNSNETSEQSAKLRSMGSSSGSIRIAIIYTFQIVFMSRIVVVNHRRDAVATLFIRSIDW